MILWLASYPRSGNTLCRLVMHQCFGAGSYSDQGNKFEKPVIGLGEESGLLEYDAEWENFYAHASPDSKLHLVKTHQHPCDDQPAIVILRDPRSSLCGYFHYLRRNCTHTQFSLAQIIQGEVIYGGWIEFYKEWLNRNPASTLLVYFEELADLKPQTLARISAFTGMVPITYEGVDFEFLRGKNSGFFRSGHLSWKGDKEWTPAVEDLFRQHFALELGKHGWI